MLTPRPVLILLTLALLGSLGVFAQSATGHTRQAAADPDRLVAPTKPLPVGFRELTFWRGSRHLPTVVWYPESSGRFPVVLLSHGLGGRPEGFAGLATHLAARGFVVVAPAYPFTKKDTPAFNRDDVRNQPADAVHVLDAVLKLNNTRDDPFEHHLLTSRACAAGFSAGGFTTSGMLTADRDPRLRCGIVISAGAIEGGFTGAPVPVLFVHGNDDGIVTYSRGRTAYKNLKWPKAFLTMRGQGHGEFLDPRRSGFVAVSSAVTDFLRWNLYQDSTARDRLRTSLALETAL